VQQHAQDVVGNVMCFIGNLTNFPAVKAIENKLRFDQITVIDLGRTSSICSRTRCMWTKTLHPLSRITHPLPAFSPNRWISEIWKKSKLKLPFC